MLKLLTGTIAGVRVRPIVAVHVELAVRRIPVRVERIAVRGEGPLLCTFFLFTAPLVSLIFRMTKVSVFSRGRGQCAPSIQN